MADIFSSVVDEGRHTEIYRSIRDMPHLYPVKAMIQEAFSTFCDIDRNFIEQFQTTGFDARLFELYVWMCLKESNFEVDRSHKFPDYIISNGCNRVAVEVTTATGGLPVDSKYVTHDNNPMPERDVNSAQFKHYVKNDVPLMFSSAILSKLQMKYWEKEHCKDTCY